MVNKRLLKILTTITCTIGFHVFPPAVYSQTLIGAGATFPYPIYSLWAYNYNKLYGLKLNYQSIGSGGGIAQIIAKTVDFGATDTPLKIDELDKNGLIQFPLVMGGVVPVVKLDNVSSGQLKLTPEVLAEIFLGDINKWNDLKITSLNPGLPLPNRGITVVHRADGSGTTWIFTNYLDKVSNTWHKRVGSGKAVLWPVGIGGKGNEGVATYVQRIRGAIGYVEFAVAMQSQMTTVMLQNRDGTFVSPSSDSFSDAAANADWKSTPGFYVVLTDQKGKNSWPITGASYILIHKEQKDQSKAKQMLDFFHWCYTDGAKMAVELHYIPIPRTVAELVEVSWRNTITSNGKPVWQ